MYIISKFRDYYDSASTYGVDKSCKYIRETKEIPIKHDKYNSIILKHQRLSSDGTPNKTTTTRFILGVCGEIYQGVCIDDFYNSYITKSKFLFDKSHKRSKNRFIASEEDDFWNKDTWKKYKSIFREYNAPVFVVGMLRDGAILDAYSGCTPVRCFINPKLRDFGFMQIMSPTEVFQNIQMYIQGVLGMDDPEMIELKESDKVKKHGFDSKSFRKEPGTKRRSKK